MRTQARTCRAPSASTVSHYRIVKHVCDLIRGDTLNTHWTMWDPAVFARSRAAVKSFRFVGITVKVLYIKAVHECVWDWLNKPCSRNGFECLNWVENCHWSTSPFLKNRSIWSHTHARFVCHTQKNIHAYSCDWEPQPWPLFPSPFWKGLLLYLPPWRRSLALGMGSYTPPPVYLTYLYKYNTPV